MTSKNLAPVDWLQAIQSTSEQLREAILGGQLGADAEAYAQLMLAYREGDLRALEEWVVARSKSPGLPGAALLPLAQARLEIRARRCSRETMFKLEKMAESPSTQQGEAWFVLGQFLGALGEIARAESAFRQAAQVLEAEGACRKSLVAQFNAISYVSQLKARSFFGAEFIRLAERCLLAGDQELMGHAYQSASREFQKMGAYNIALEHSRLAVESCADDLSSLNSSLMLAHHAHVLLDLGRIAEYEEYIESLKVSPFREVNAILSVLKCLRGGQTWPGDAELDALPFTWRERFARAKSGAVPPRALGALEGRTLLWLCKGGGDARQLGLHLYGTQIDEESRIIRAQNLLKRLRAKCPGVFVHQEGAYRLIDSERGGSRTE